MFSENNLENQNYSTVEAKNHEQLNKLALDKLQSFYNEIMVPVEELTNFYSVVNTKLKQADFVSAPVVLILGPYSAGKTTFISYMCKKDIPNSNIGVEPTTDKFTAVCWASDDGIIPGSSLALFPTLPFSNLKQFGNDFMSNLEGAMMNCELLKNITFIDTPGLLSTTQSNLGRR